MIIPNIWENKMFQTTNQTNIRKLWKITQLPIQRVFFPNPIVIPIENPIRIWESLACSCQIESPFSHEFQ